MNPTNIVAAGARLAIGLGVGPVDKAIEESVNLNFSSPVNNSDFGNRTDNDHVVTSASAQMSSLAMIFMIIFIQI